MIARISRWFRHRDVVPEDKTPRLARRLAREGQYQDAWEAME